jgi:hypothetical protein
MRVTCGLIYIYTDGNTMMLASHGMVASFGLEYAQFLDSSALFTGIAQAPEIHMVVCFFLNRTLWLHAYYHVGGSVGFCRVYHNDPLWYPPSHMCKKPYAAGIEVSLQQK